MPKRAAIRESSEPQEIFTKVLQSLESHRPSKTDHDVLDEVRIQFHLLSDFDAWPEELVDKDVAVEDFLKCVMDQLGPFVDMLTELYEFLHRYVSTSGGRTEHFDIANNDLSRPWRFDTSRLPRRIRWVAAWRKLRIEEIAVNWEKVHECLRIDGAVFYGTVDDIRFIQSLIVNRRKKTLSPAMRALGDQLYGIFQRIGSAWYRKISMNLKGQSLPM